MLQLLFFITLSSACLFNCTTCEKGYTLIENMCISTTHKIDPENNFKCTDTLCLFDYSKSTKKTIEISTYLSTLILSQSKTTINLNYGKIQTILSGKEIIFGKQTEITKINLEEASLTALNILKSEKVECKYLSVENSVEIEELRTKLFKMKFDHIRSQKIKQFVVKGKVTIQIVVNNDQREEIEKNGIYVFHETKFVFENDSSNVNNTKSEIVLEIVENDKVVQMSNVKFYTDVCKSKRMSAFLKEAPKDKDVACPDYIFVQPTTEAWWISSIVLLCLIVVVVVLAVVYLVIKKVRENKSSSEF